MLKKIISILLVVIAIFSCTIVSFANPIPNDEHYPVFYEMCSCGSINRFIESRYVGEVTCKKYPIEYGITNPVYMYIYECTSCSKVTSFRGTVCVN